MKQSFPNIKLPKYPVTLTSKDAKETLKYPAMYMIALACVGVVFFTWIAVYTLNLGATDFDPGRIATRDMAQRKAVVVALVVVGYALAAIVLYGASQMLKVKNYSWALAASTIAAIGSVLVFVLLPAGVWLFRLIRKPEVKAAFTQAP